MAGAAGWALTRVTAVLLEKQGLLRQRLGLFGRLKWEFVFQWIC